MPISIYFLLKVRVAPMSLVAQEVVNDSLEDGIICLHVIGRNHVPGYFYIVFNIQYNKWNARMACWKMPSETEAEVHGQTMKICSGANQ